MTFVLCSLKATLLLIPQSTAQVFPFLHILSIKVLFSVTYQTNTFYEYGMVSIHPCIVNVHIQTDANICHPCSQIVTISVEKDLDSLSFSFSELHIALPLCVVTLLTKGTQTLFYLPNHNLWLVEF